MVTAYVQSLNPLRKALEFHWFLSWWYSIKENQTETAFQSLQREWYKFMSDIVTKSHLTRVRLIYNLTDKKWTILLSF